MYLDAKLNLIQEESAYLFFNPLNESIAWWFPSQTFEPESLEAEVGFEFFKLWRKAVEWAAQVERERSVRTRRTIRNEPPVVPDPSEQPTEDPTEKPSEDPTGEPTGPWAKRKVLLTQGPVL